MHRPNPSDPGAQALRPLFDSKSLARQQTGARAASAGTAFEKELERTHTVYAAMGMARLRQLPVPTAPAPRYLADKLPGLRIRQARQCYDYFGVMGPRAGPTENRTAWVGFSLAMEAKRTGTTATALAIALSTGGSKRGQKSKKKGGGGLSAHQLEALATDYRDFGALSVVVWRNGDQRLVLLPDALLAAWEAYRTGGRKSVAVASFTRYDAGLAPGHGVIEDWLTPVREWLERKGTPPDRHATASRPMIRFSIDAERKQITIFTPGGDKVVIDNVRVTDQATVMQLSQESRTVDEFAAKLKATEVANE